MAGIDRSPHVGLVIKVKPSRLEWRRKRLEKLYTFPELVG